MLVYIDDPIENDKSVKIGNYDTQVTKTEKQVE